VDRTGVFSSRGGPGEGVSSLAAANRPLQVDDSLVRERDAHATAGETPTGRGRPPALQLLGAAFVHPQELHALGVETSESERRAADAERELIEWKKVSFMAQHIGDEFEALIISLIKPGFFVELTDLFVEGFVPLASLDDDTYVYRERLRAIIGQHSKRAFRLGQQIRVRLVRIDRSENKLEFSVAE
jgi:ribonuclease R